MARIGSQLANRIANMRSGNNQHQNHHAPVAVVSPTRSPRSPSGFQATDHTSRVDLMLQDPAMFHEFKRRVAQSKTCSNVGANYVLQNFLTELEMHGLGDQSPNSPYSRNNSMTMDESETSHATNTAQETRGWLSGLRTALVEPPSPSTISYQLSPRSRFACPESPGSIQNLSPIQTPVSPISATSSSSMRSPSSSTMSTDTPRSTSSPMEEDEREDPAVTARKKAKKKEARARAAMMFAGLEQPSLQ